MEEDLASTLHELRLELKLLPRKQCRLARLQNPGMTHPMQRMLLCTLIACLCNDDALARMWAVWIGVGWAAQGTVSMQRQP